MVEGLGLPKNTTQNRSLLTSEWTAKVFPGHFEFYHFIPLSTQPCGMLIARRAGGASEITLQRWRLCYAQRASRFNARCPELWLIAPGCCCNTSSALVKRFEAQRARSLHWYTDLRCRGANVEGLLIFFISFFFYHHKQEIVEPRLIFKITCSWKKKKVILDDVLREGDDGDLLWRDASPDFALSDALGVDGFRSTVEDKWKVMVSWGSRST